MYSAIFFPNLSACGVNHVVRMEALRFFRLKLKGVKSSRQTGAVETMEVRRHNWQALFPLILFLDVLSRTSVRAIYSCYIFDQNSLPSGMWLLPWHLTLAASDIVFKGRPSIPLSSPLNSPLFSHPPTLPPPPAFLLFVMLSHSLRGHAVTLFTGSHAGARCMGVCALSPDLFV